MLKKAPMKFDKELFKGTVLNNIKTHYRRTLEEATEQQIFQAVSYAIKDVVVDNWMATQKEYEKKDPKIVYYMSMEFLMGRALGNNLINLRAYKEVAEALDELGVDLNLVEDQEPDPALGNGGLGRLAACFLDSLATLNYAAYGCGIRYRYGMFRQEIRDGYQVEVPDNWLADGYPFELRFYESCPLAVEDLVNGRIEAALMDSLPAGDAIARGKAVKKAGVHGEPDQFGVAIRKDDAETMKLVNEGYKLLKADPYWKELQAKYLGNK